MMKKTILLLAAVSLITPVFNQTKNPKRGISYGYHTEEDFQAISTSISWWYNWAGTPESAVADIFESYDMDFVPMAWNGYYNEASLRDFYANHPGAKFLLGFNEPNFIDQANMTPSEAAAEWPGLEAIADDYGLDEPWQWVNMKACEDLLEKQFHVLLSHTSPTGIGGQSTSYGSERLRTVTAFCQPHYHFFAHYKRPILPAKIGRTKCYWVNDVNFSDRTERIDLPLRKGCMGILSWVDESNNDFKIIDAEWMEEMTYSKWWRI